MYPKVDPIPLPAPVWLMKSLGLLTLTAHFVAVQLLIGGLLMVALLNLRGHRRGSERGQAERSASLVLARRLPTVMTYVINLGVPPLLFAQVLYGRVLYTSSVLIAVKWISVVFLLMAAYWLLYRLIDRIAQGKPAALMALAALVLAAGVGDIFALNMTLMLRPEVWQGMYGQTATGTLQPPHDPTTIPRWLFLMCGGPVFAGVGMLLLALQKSLGEATRRVLHRDGAIIAAIMAVPQILLAVRIYQLQTAPVQMALNNSLLCRIASVLYFAGVLFIIVLAAAQALRRSPSLPLALLSAVGGIVSVAGAVLYRDGIRDFTLFTKGFDVWDRTVVANWGVIGLFLILLVIGLVAIGWLISVMLRATPVREEVVS